MPKLGVIYPWASPFFYTEAHDNMVNLRHPDGWETRFFRGTGWCPATRHNNGCDAALRWGADLLCIIGSDQLHPEDMLERLVARVQEGYEVVAALVPCRGYVSWQPMKPFQSMAWRFKPNAPSDSKLREYRGMHLDGDMVEVITRGQGEMQRVNFIGSGVLLFHRDHLLALTPPWFRETIDPKTFQRLANQDCVFAWRLQLEAHAQVWVDTTIAVKHLHVFPIDDTYSERFADWGVSGGDPAICRYEMPAVLAQASESTEGRYLYRMTQGNTPHRKRLDLTMEWAGDLTGQRVLEVGSDDGTYMKAFAERGAIVVGCDPHLSPAVRLDEARCTFYPVAVEQLPETIGNFDLVHLGELLEHVNDPQHLLMTCITRWPMARYLVAVPNFAANDHRRVYTQDSFLAELSPWLNAQQMYRVEWETGDKQVRCWYIARCTVHPKHVRQQVAV